MRNQLGIHVNGREVLCYDRSAGVPGRRRQFLAQMDRDMDEGIRLGGQAIVNPDTRQRARYVAMQLLHALETGNQHLAETLCAWLATQLPELQALHAVEADDTVTVDFDFGTTGN